VLGRLLVDLPVGDGLPFADHIRGDREGGVDERDLDVPVTLGPAVRRVRLKKLNHTEAVEPRRDALIADELEG